MTSETEEAAAAERDKKRKAMAEIKAIWGPHNTPRLTRSSADEHEVAAAQDGWPTLLRPMKWLAKSEDKGLGDIIARVVGPVGGDAFKVWYKATFGTACDCEARQEEWNARYPL